MVLILCQLPVCVWTDVCVHAKARTVLQLSVMSNYMYMVSVNPMD